MDFNVFSATKKSIYLLKIFGVNFLLETYNHSPAWYLNSRVTLLLLPSMQTLVNANFLSKWDIFGYLSPKVTVKWPN